MKTINIQKTIYTSANKVFSHLTEQDKLMLWFAPQVIAVPSKNTIAAFAFGSEVNFKMKITEFEENKDLEWLCVDGNVDWLNSLVKFTLKEDTAGKTILKFKHSKLDDHEKMDLWKSSWKSYLSQLKIRCESGK